VPATFVCQYRKHPQNAADAEAHHRITLEAPLAWLSRAEQTNVFRFIFLLGGTNRPSSALTRSKPYGPVADTRSSSLERVPRS
jgi:hypothetical protein